MGHRLADPALKRPRGRPRKVEVHLVVDRRAAVAMCGRRIDDVTHVETPRSFAFLERHLDTRVRCCRTCERVDDHARRLENLAAMRTAARVAVVRREDARRRRG